MKHVDPIARLSPCFVVEIAIIYLLAVHSGEESGALVVMDRRLRMPQVGSGVLAERDEIKVASDFGSEHGDHVLAEQTSALAGTPA
jgi:hypothetical protein